MHVVYSQTDWQAKHHALKTKNELENGLGVLLSARVCAEQVQGLMPNTHTTPNNDKRKRLWYFCPKRLKAVLVGKSFQSSECHPVSHREGATLNIEHFENTHKAKW